MSTVSLLLSWTAALAAQAVPSIPSTRMDFRGPQTEKTLTVAVPVAVYSG